MKIKPLNGFILVSPRRNQTEKVFKEDDSRRDLQYADVVALPYEEIILRNEGNKKEILKLNDIVVYNPRTMTAIVHDNKVYGMVHNENLLAVL